MIVEALQTLEDRDNIDQIEKEGPFKCIRSDAWLGQGYYFWDTNMDWAIQWGKNSYEKSNKEYVIGRCRVNLDAKCYDLFGNVAHLIDLKQIIKAIVDTGYLSKDRITVPKLIEYLKSKGLFNYNSIRAGDFPKKPHQLPFNFKLVGNKFVIKEYMVINQRVQICVIVKNDVILPPFSVIYPEKYLN